MCKCIVQGVFEKDPLSFLMHMEPLDDAPVAPTPEDVHAAFAQRRQRENVIKPNMQVSAILRRGEQLECVKVRWGWSPVWSMGTRPPLTHLPLHLVMRSKAFDKVRRDGRALVAVDGWYDVNEATASSQVLTYTTGRRSTPIFLAALAQVNEHHSGCEGLVLIHDTGSDNSRRLLAFNAEQAANWLAPELDWDAARQLASQYAVSEQQLEHLLTAKRLTPHRGQ